MWGTFRDANGRLGVGTGTDDNDQVEKAVLKEPAKLTLPQKVRNVFELKIFDSGFGFSSEI